jgi:hypothetical protein|tara:strand:- start:8206 stop:10077 length:1872 start_codon:yes stop_codon:yes gene_type:complete
MTWEQGKQISTKQDKDINQQILDLEGSLEENDAKYYLYKFLKENTTFGTQLLTGVELFPFQHLAIKTMFETDYFLGVWGRGMSKSFTTGLYALMDAIFNQGVEIGILSKSFRQAKMIFRKMEDIASKPDAKYLNQCITKITKSNDEWLMQIGDSNIRALPLGDGSKLRGFRFHRIIIDEFLLMPERIYNEVIVPFLSVVENPQQRQKIFDLESRLIDQGKMTEEDRYIWPNNKLIMLSSASYKFEYLYKLYETFQDLILDERMKRSPFDAKRAIMHFSFDQAPEKLYDQNLVAQAKATMSHSQFAREFESVFTDDSSGYFKTSKMAECTVPDGDAPTVEVAGEKGAKYILSFDPSWSESEGSDDFAMQILKINEETNKNTLVHSYAMAGTRLKDHINYFHYLIKSFNIVLIVGDYNGGVQFINAANESKIFKDKKIKIKLLEQSFDKAEDYQKDLIQTKRIYDPKDYSYCILRKPTSDWIRKANELLQSSIDHKKIWFAARAVDDAYLEQKSKKIPIKELKFIRGLDQEERNPGAKMIDLVEHLSDNVNSTKGQCALIQVYTSPQGHQTFDLPPELRKSTGPNKARKDSYSAIVLGNWGCKIYKDMMSAESVGKATFTPMFIR